MSTELMDPKTGEVVAVAKYDARDYLATLTKHDGIGVQRQLSAAYDAAVASLIGPNDVQMEGTRSFKKKSAWRKLARYFNISVAIAKVEHTVLEGSGHFLCTVTARAVAPWGQSYEEVGACCTDEATGRRVITVADAIATASTRAGNRAVSNLIAMGEVSAEEVGDRASHDAPRPARATGPAPAARPASGNPGDFLMPMGKTKGTPLKALDAADLRSAVEWAESKGKFTEFVAAARAVLDDHAEDVREMGGQAGAVQSAGPDDDLPF